MPTKKHYSVQRRNCLEHYIPRRILDVCPMVLLGGYELEFCRELRFFLCFFARNIKKNQKQNTFNSEDSTIVSCVKSDNHCIV